MVCPKCANERSYVTDTDKSGPIVERIRLCKKCRYVWRTKEIPIFDLMDTEEIKAYERYIAQSLVKIKG